MRFPVRLRRLHNPPRAVLLASVLAAIGLASLQLSNAADNQRPNAAVRTSAMDLAAEQIVVRYKPQADTIQLNSAIAQAGASIRDEVKPLRMKVLKVRQADRQRVLDRLKADPRVEFAEPDVLTQGDVTRPNDPEYAKQWSWPTTLTDLLWDKQKGGNMVVAVVDSGINASHPEFAGKLVAGYDYINNDDTPEDEHSHGTAVAGVIGALTNNSSGVAAGCWGCRIMPLKVLDATNSALSSNIAKAVTFAADNGAKIINISLSGSGTSAAEEAAVTYAVGKGVIVVTSAGNESNDESRRPARYPNVISVAGTNQADGLASYSSFGETVDIAAPGTARTTDYDSDGFVDIQGTSFAAPTVSAILATLWTAFPNASPASLRQAILSTADTCCDGKIPGGRINAIKAYNVLAGTQNADTVKPSVNFASPAAGASINGPSVPLVVTATDNVGVAKVHMQIRGGSPTVSLSAPYVFSWNSVSASDGEYIITATAYDAAGNEASVTRTLIVNNTTPTDTTKPSLSLTAPADGATVSGTVQIGAETADANGIAKVDFFVDSSLQAIDISSPYSFNWNTASVPNGQHSFRVRSHDATGNNIEVTRTVTVQNGGSNGTVDINGDGKVNITDLSILLSAWGTADAKADLNKNGKVDITDLSLLLSGWTR